MNGEFVKGRKIEILIKIFFSIFLSYLSVFILITDIQSIKLGNVLILSGILMLIYALLIPYIRIYSFIVEKIGNLVSKTKLKNVKEKIVSSIFLPSMILGSVSLLLIIISSFYTNAFQTAPLGERVDYRSFVANLNSITLLLMTLISAIVIVYLQIKKWVKEKKLNISGSFVVSILSLIIFMFVIFLIRNIMVIIVAILA